MATPASMILAAFQELGVVGTSQSATFAEDTEYALGKWNRLRSQWNTRQRNAYFKRFQDFIFTTAKQSYTIGKSTNTPTPDFAVAAGNRPVRIEYAQLIQTDVSPYSYTPIPVITVQQYVAGISIPGLVSGFPNTIYYVPEVPNGKIIPWPAYPSFTSYGLRLYWWDQFDQISIADLATELALPDGSENFQVLKLAVALYTQYPNKTDFDELKRQAREAAADYQSLNVVPPYVDSTDGISGLGGNGFDWRSRTPIGLGG